MRVAVIGAGISGLGAASTLAENGVTVTVFERASRIGGHAHSVALPGEGVDSGELTRVSFLIVVDGTLSKMANEWSTHLSWCSTRSHIQT